MKKSVVLGLLVAGIGLTLFCGCRRRDMRAAAIKTPGMVNAACAERIVEAVRRAPGVEAASVTADLDNRVVNVRYDGLILARKNIEFFIAEAGFQANELPPDAGAAAQLPPECRPAGAP